MKLLREDLLVTCGGRSGEEVKSLRRLLVSWSYCREHRRSGVGQLAPKRDDRDKHGMTGQSFPRRSWSPSRSRRWWASRPANGHWALPVEQAARLPERASVVSSAWVRFTSISSSAAGRSTGTWPEVSARSSRWRRENHRSRWSKMAWGKSSPPGWATRIIARPFVAGPGVVLVRQHVRAHWPVPMALAAAGREGLQQKFRRRFSGASALTADVRVGACRPGGDATVSDEAWRSMCL